MADDKKDSKRPIIIKKSHDDHHDDHHGGAWKVAYADFVTAMMAFFLLLWILNAVQEENLKGIADYFAPTISSTNASYGEGLLSGETIGPPGIMNSSTAPLETMSDPNVGKDEPGKKDVVVRSEDAEDAAGKLSEGAKEAQNQAFTEVERKVVQAMKKAPDLKPLLPNIIFDKTPEGLRIQIVDQERKPMFATGSATMLQATNKLMGVVGSAIKELPNKITITGHTDAHPYPGGAQLSGYSNWELSADRANATRRVMLENGVAENRFVRVSGAAFAQPLKAEDPFAAVNRRVDILLRYLDSNEIPVQVLIKDGEEQ